LKRGPLSINAYFCRFKTIIYRMKKILVTGSAGKLGSVTVNYLRQNGYEVIGADIMESATTDVLLDIKSVRNAQKITKLVDVIVHTAAMHGKHFELKYPRQDFIKTNIDGTFNLLNACVKNGVKKLIYISTTSIYGNAMVDKNKAVWVDESLNPDPRDIYDITKLTAELLCRDFFEKEGIETISLRVSRFLPENDNLKAIHRLYRGLDERDGAAAIRLAIEHQFDQFEVLNISADSPFQREDVANLMVNCKTVLLKYYPQLEAIFNQKNWQFPNQIDRVYSIEKAKEMLNYQPKYNFDSFI
jgi:UDP-glucose 4-epimerase